MRDEHDPTPAAAAPRACVRPLWTHAWAAAGAAAVALAAVCYFAIDRPLAELVRQRPDWAGVWASRVTELAEAGVYLIGLVPVFLICLWRGRKWGAEAAALAWLSVASSGILVNVVKVILARARPKLYFEKNVYGFEFFRVGYAFNSFPSGHATTMGALCVAVSILWPRWRPLWFVLAAALALTRVAAQAHFLSDVVMGFFLGAACAQIVAALLSRLIAGRGAGRPTSL